MQRCRALAEVGRRQFLRGGTAAAVGAAAAAVGRGEAKAAAVPNAALVSYPVNRLANLADLKVDAPVDVAYPDADAPGVLLKLGRPVPGGVGPEGDVVGFTTLCPHKGYPLRYDARDRTLSCPGHYSRFDPEKGGLEIWGHATQNLPQYALRVDEKGDVYAEGVDELLYSRLSNVLG
jgi:arsenite oxidase small subunit